MLGSQAAVDVVLAAQLAGCTSYAELLQWCEARQDMATFGGDRAALARVITVARRLSAEVA